MTVAYFVKFNARRSPERITVGSNGQHPHYHAFFRWIEEAVTLAHYGYVEWMIYEGRA